jgi:hypothetical protein
MSTTVRDCTVLPVSEFIRYAHAAHWVQLGGEVVMWSPEASMAPSMAPGLALVTQVGRAFQDAHPAVPVLLDHGRHLIVDAGHLPGPVPADACWRIEPVPVDTVVVDRPATARRAAPDHRVADLLGSLSVDRWETDLRRLVAHGTRHSTGQGHADAARWCHERFASLGYATTSAPITVGAAGGSVNVIAERAGTGPAPRPVVLVTAHLDSVNLAGGPAAPAPGADDNGSGSAGVLELARVLASRAWPHDLRLILFSGEEQGLYGSRQYVAGLPAPERGRIRAVLNMDMVGTRNTAEPAVLLEGAPPFRQLVDDLATAAATHTTLRVETSLSPFASDHVPFIDAGIPAVLTIEGADSANGNIHSDRDTMDHIDPGLAGQILRMNLAALAGWLGGVAGPTGPAGRAAGRGGPVVSRAPGLLDVFATAPDGTLLHKAWDGTAWQPAPTGYASLGRPTR